MCIRDSFFSSFLQDGASHLQGCNGISDSPIYDSSHHYCFITWLLLRLFSPLSLPTSFWFCKHDISWIKFTVFGKFFQSLLTCTALKYASPLWNYKSFVSLLRHALLPVHLNLQLAPLVTRLRGPLNAVVNPYEWIWVINYTNTHKFVHKTVQQNYWIGILITWTQLFASGND